MVSVKWTWVLFVLFGFSATISHAAAPDVLGSSKLVAGKISPEGSMDDPRSQLHGWITASLSVLIPCLGLAYGVLISTCKEWTFKRQDLLGLMSLMASLCWWVLTATTITPSDGKSSSISTWLALFAVFIAKHRRLFRNGNRYLFTCLLGGLAFTTIIAGIAILMSEDMSRVKPPSMREFVVLALMVGPTVTTVWSWAAALIFQIVEGQSGSREQDPALALELELTNLRARAVPEDDVRSV